MGSQSSASGRGGHSFVARRSSSRCYDVGELDHLSREFSMHMIFASSPQATQIGPAATPPSIGGG